MRRLIALAFMLTTSFSALAQDKMPPVEPQAFVDQAAVSGLFEIEASRIALDKTKNESVRMFAQHMIDDHTKAGKELKQAAVDQPVPSELDPEHKALVATLNGADATAFDAIYIDQQVEAHKEAVSLFTNFSTIGPNGSLKGFAAKTLPVLQQHQEMVGTLKG